MSETLSRVTQLKIGNICLLASERSEWKRVFNAIVTGRINFLCLEKQAISQEFSHTLELKYKVRLA